MRSGWLGLARTGPFLALVACSTAIGPGGDPNDPPGDPSPEGGDWECATADEITQCERAGTGERQSYTCTAGEAGCPPSGSADGEDWACIAEETETKCREVAAETVTASMRPTDCDVPAWKTFFCQLADAQLAAHGIDYTMPCDALADQLQLEPLSSGACNELVDQLELESWTEAAYAGCTGALSQAITAWCYNTNLMLSGAAVCQ